MKRIAHPLLRSTLITQPRTVNFFLAGVESTCPAGSIARTLKTCLPGSTFLYFFGDLQRSNGLPSSLQRKTEPTSLDSNAKRAALLRDFFLGAFTIFVRGRVRSADLPGLPGLPALPASPPPPPPPAPPPPSVVAVASSE